ncbi:MAG: alpha/beta hydrolase [Pseudomonadota bacterium]
MTAARSTHRDQDGAPRREAVFIPGLLCTDAVFAPQMSSLGGPAGHLTCRAVDAAAHDALDSAAEHIVEGLAPGSLLVGLSMGASIALEVARRAGGRVGGLVLISASARADRPVQAEARREFLSRASASVNGLAAAVDELTDVMLAPTRRNDEHVRALRLEMAEALGIDGLARQTEALISRRDLRETLCDVAAPTLLIVGSDDAMTPRKLADEMLTALPNAALEVIPGCAHLATLEYPATVTALIRRFAATLPPQNAQA